MKTQKFKTVEWGDLDEVQKNQAIHKLKRIGADPIKERRMFKYTIWLENNEVRSIIEGLN